MKKNIPVRWEIKTWQEINLEEWYAIGALRISVFVVEQNCPYQDFDGNDSKSDHVIGYNQSNELIAYARVVFPKTIYPHVSIGRVVVAKKERGKNIGFALMQRCLNFISEKYGHVIVHISAQKHLQIFYESLGFSQTTDTYLEDDIPHIGMEKKV